jgi:Tol biopolymer transport system component
VTKIPSGGGNPVDLVEGGRIPGFPVRWSPAGDWIAYSSVSPPNVLRLVSPDGSKKRTLLENGYQAWTFDRSGSRIYGLRRGEGRRWEMWLVDVDTGVERRVVVLNIPVERDVMSSLSLHPDGTRFLAGIEIATSDLWIIEGVQSR